MRLNTARQKKLEPKRMEYAVKKIEALGFRITFRDNNMIQFKFNGSTVSLWPYSGWHSGSFIQDGRGFKHLLNQIKEK
jgi:hypothetical protein